MPERRMVLNDAARFGEIVKDWARDPTLRPETVKDFLGQVSVSVATLEGYAIGERLNYVELQPDSLGPNVIIPALEDMEAPAPKGRYPLPIFYEQIAFHVVDDIADEDREKFKLSRIADYSFAKCQ